MKKPLPTSSKIVSPVHDPEKNVVQDRSPKELAEFALLFYNEAARLRRSQEYQFVKDKSYNHYRADGASTVWHHLNFVARPTLGTEEITFFAEIRGRETELLIMMCRIVGRASEDIPSLAGCKICDKDDCRDTVIHPIIGITKEIETTSMEEDQVHNNTLVWKKPLPASSMNVNPVHDPKLALINRKWSPEELAVVALNFYNEAARLSKSPQFQYVKVTSSSFLYCGRATTWHHLNFIARPTSETDEFTFFAEIRVHRASLSIMRCQIVCSTAEETACLGGCEMCDNYKERNIIHPITGVYYQRFAGPYNRGTLARDGIEG